MIADQGERLLQAVLKDPADEMLRLVYADWLEENGELDRADRYRRAIVSSVFYVRTHGVVVDFYAEWLPPDPYSVRDNLPGKCVTLILCRLGEKLLVDCALVDSVCPDPLRPGVFHVRGTCVNPRDTFRNRPTLWLDNPREPK